jgi:hypothetical protein
MYGWPVIQAQRAGEQAGLDFNAAATMRRLGLCEGLVRVKHSYTAIND